MVKVFRMNSKNYDESFLNEWADKNNYKIDNINVCPDTWYLNSDKTRVTDMNIIITVLYHKKRERKNKNGNIK